MERTKIILRLKNQTSYQFKQYIIKTCYHIYSFAFSIKLNYPEKWKGKIAKVKTIHRTGFEREPLDPQSCILPLDCCTRWVITLEIKRNKSLLIQGKTTQFPKQN